MYTDTKSKELAILNYIEQNSDATQRELSDHIGMSLGAINLLVKQLVKKGLVKVEHLTPTSVKYFLTPAGIANKVERTYAYIIRTYNEIDQLRNRIVTATNFLARTYETDQVIFYGPNDDFATMVKDLIVLNSFEAQATLLHTDNQIKNQSPIIVWREETQHTLTQQGVESVNILGMVNIG